MSLVLADSALEIVPRSLREHPSVVSNAKRSGQLPERTLLDSSYHHRAMRRLLEVERRGRPDIVHMCALLALGSRAAAARRLRLYIHTYGGEVISVAPGTRLPRVYDRFKGLMAQLLAQGKVPEDDPLLVVEDVDLPELLRALAPERVLALSSRAPRAKWAQLLPPDGPARTMAVLLGAFPRGGFREPTARLATETASVADGPLEAWAVEAELLVHLATSMRLE